MAKKQSKELKTKDYEKLGKLLVSLGQIGLTEDARRKVYRISFLKGIATGIGSAIGATIVFAFLLYVLSLFSEIPFIGSIFESLQDTIDSVQTTP